jgi:hypothetical protein
MRSNNKKILLKDQKQIDMALAHAERLLNDDDSISRPDVPAAAVAPTPARKSSDERRREPAGARKTSDERRVRAWSMSASADSHTFKPSPAPRRKSDEPDQRDDLLSPSTPLPTWLQTMATPDATEPTAQELLASLKSTGPKRADEPPRAPDGDVLKGLSRHRSELRSEIASIKGLSLSLAEVSSCKMCRLCRGCGVAPLR